MSNFTQNIYQLLITEIAPMLKHTDIGVFLSRFYCKVVERGGLIFLIRKCNNPGSQKYQDMSYITGI